MAAGDPAAGPAASGHAWRWNMVFSLKLRRHGTDLSLLMAGLLVRISDG
jgi:hypothetical protein